MSKQLSKYVAKDIEGYEGVYAITECGKIYAHSRVDKGGNLRKGRWMKYTTTKQGYLKVTLSDCNGVRATHQVHRLVALTFLPNHLGLPEVNHKDEVKGNPHKDNLEWCTSQYNIEYSNSRTFTIKHLSGETYSGKNVERFCREHGLISSCLLQVLNGTRATHAGWSL